MRCDANVYLSIGWLSHDIGPYSVFITELFFFGTSLFYGELTLQETLKKILLRIGFKQI